MTYFTATIGLRGSNGKVVPMNFDLGEFTGISLNDFPDALDALNQIRGALVDITSANIAYVRLHHEVEADSTEPANADVFETAMVNVHIAPAGEAEKLTQIYIPAPVIGIFEGTTGNDRDIVDRDDSDLQQYIQQLAQHSFVSDGEQIQTAVGAGGIKNGRRVIKPHKLGRVR